MQAAALILIAARGESVGAFAIGHAPTLPPDVIAESVAAAVRHEHTAAGPLRVPTLLSLPGAALAAVVQPFPLPEGGYIAVAAAPATFTCPGGAHVAWPARFARAVATALMEHLGAHSVDAAAANAATWFFLDEVAAQAPGLSLADLGAVAKAAAGKDFVRDPPSEEAPLWAQPRGLAADSTMAALATLSHATAPPPSVGVRDLPLGTYPDSDDDAIPAPAQPVSPSRVTWAAGVLDHTPPATVAVTPSEGASRPDTPTPEPAALPAALLPTVGLPAATAAATIAATTAAAVAVPTLAAATTVAAGAVASLSDVYEVDVPAGLPGLPDHLPPGVPALHADPSALLPLSSTQEFTEAAETAVARAAADTAEAAAATEAAAQATAQAATEAAAEAAAQAAARAREAAFLGSDSVTLEPSVPRTAASEAAPPPDIHDIFFTMTASVPRVNLRSSSPPPLVAATAALPTTSGEAFESLKATPAPAMALAAATTAVAVAPLAATALADAAEGAEHRAREAAPHAAPVASLLAAWDDAPLAVTPRQQSRRSSVEPEVAPPFTCRLAVRQEETLQYESAPGGETVMVSGVVALRLLFDAPPPPPPPQGPWLVRAVLRVPPAVAQCAEYLPQARVLGRVACDGGTAVTVRVAVPAHAGESARVDVAAYTLRYTAAAPCPLLPLKCEVLAQHTLVDDGVAYETAARVRWAWNPQCASACVRCSLQLRLPVSATQLQLRPEGTTPGAAVWTLFEGGQRTLDSATPIAVKYRHAASPTAGPRVVFDAVLDMRGVLFSAAAVDAALPDDADPGDVPVALAAEPRSVAGVVGSYVFNAKNL